VKHTLQPVVVLLVKTPGRSIPMFGQLVDLPVKKKIEG